jgi:hypothetical protein
MELNEANAHAQGMANSSGQGESSFGQLANGAWTGAWDAISP